MAQTDFTRQTYLIVDDMASIREFLRTLLRTLGATQLDQASTGAAAIARMEGKRYDVVLCDYNLGPGRNGQQVLEEARHRALIGVAAIFIMVTAEKTRDMVMGAVEYTPDAYLTKPFTMDLLKTRLATLFERKSGLGGVDRALRSGDHGAAIAGLNRLLAAKPGNPTDLLRLKADVCLTANRLDEAMAIYDALLANRALNWALLGKGKILFQNKQYGQAGDIFARLLDSEPHFLLAYDWLAKTQVAEQDYDGAEQTLKKAVALSPRNIERQQRLGELILKQGDGKAAEAVFERAVALARHSVLNHPSLHAGLAKSKSVNQKHNEALKIIGDIGKTFVDHREAAIYQASAMAIVKQDQGDTSGAAAALQAAEQSIVELGSGLPPRLSLEMMATCWRLGETQKATALLQQAIGNNHDDHAFLAEVVRVCHDTGLAEAADTAIRQIQRDIVRANNAGVGLIKQGDFDAAVKLLREAAEEMPGNKTINLNAAKAWIIQMENRGPSSEGIQAVRGYVARVQKANPNDWRLADLQSRLRQLAIQVPKTR
ncbi:tetratricopeptide repeat-containing response regulator [uncultured Thiocystis sp.]|jgi:tetratricopeptide (TPR) repeat protein|uniref:tetratricopeptide repeat-containing response regulator n=1 Tax=uncultured Thiocystis sp. TaxID=1202134 RepID=UPI0025CF4E1C|nr:tetratricopeptide repeat-containing response regulator [uncultured Thiocystis sp.]